MSEAAVGVETAHHSSDGAALVTTNSGITIPAVAAGGRDSKIASGSPDVRDVLGTWEFPLW